MNAKNIEQIEKALSLLRERQRAYQLAFSQPAGLAVLNDLSKFCRAVESCVIPGDRDKTLILEGRREVFLRMTEHLNLSIEQLYALYSGKHVDLKFTSEENKDA
jgi:hypothetical protein